MLDEWPALRKIKRATTPPTTPTQVTAYLICTAAPKAHPPKQILTLTNGIKRHHRIQIITTN